MSRSRKICPGLLVLAALALGTPPASPALAQGKASAREQAIVLRAELSARLEDAEDSRNSHNEWLSQLRAAQNLMDQATGQHSEKNYAQAVGTYQQAIALLDAALERGPALLAEILDSGTSLLNSEDYENAAERFREAEQIDPGNPEAAQGLADAQQGIEAAAKLREAERLIDAGDASAARQKLAGLPAGWKSSRLQRVRSRIDEGASEERFNQRMGEAHEAMAASEWERARQALERARILRPDSQLIDELLSQASKEADEAVHRQVEAKVRELLAEERWSEIAEVGAPLLGSASRFVEDVRLAQLLAALEADLDQLLEQPEMLNSPSRQARVNDAVTRAQSLQSGVRVGGKFDRLLSEKERWGRPVRVSVHSDTDATIRLHTRDVGKVKRRKPLRFDIRPGNYPLAVRRPGQVVETCELALRPDSPVSVQLSLNRPCQIQTLSRS